MLVIWDQETSPPAGDAVVILWRTFDAPPTSQDICLPQWVEQNADRMRARYLEWVFELGEARIDGRRIVDHLELRPDFSYWWMTPIAQRFNAAAATPVHDAIKLLGLEELMVDRNVRLMKLHSSNGALAECLREYCSRSQIAFEWLPGPDTTRRTWRQWTPLSIQALISAARNVTQRRGPRAQVARLASDAKVTFIDVLVHLDRSAFATGRFISNYWTALVALLTRAGVRSNWLHNYFQHEAVPSFANAAQLVERFNEQAQGRERHLLLDACIDRSVVRQALRDWWRLGRAHRQLHGMNELFQPARSAMNLWPLFRDEWREGLRGPSAMINCLTLAVVEQVLREAPRQPLGVYIQENQPWEMALLHAWKAAGHGKIVGVPHTTVRYWDLRYFYDPRSYRQAGGNALPMPDRVAVNGPAARMMYVDAGYPATEVVDVEALRYLHLADRAAAPPTIERPAGLRVLICGDFLPSTSHKMLSWMLLAAPSLPANVRFLFKPHPAYPIALDAYAALSLQQTQAPLGQLLQDCDVVFASNITSSAVDAYCRGVAVVQLLDGSTFNMSALRSMGGVVYVANAADLACALLAANEMQRPADVSYFHLDADLPRWSELLGLAPSIDCERA